MKICVLGAGITGVTSAYALAQRGHTVTVIDRQPEAARECSYANGGQLSYAHAEPWANPGVFPKLWKWMWQEDAPLVLRFNRDPHMIRWGLMFLYNCLPARAHRHCEAILRLGLYSQRQMAALMEQTAIEFGYLGNGILHVFDNQQSFDAARRHAEFQAKLGCHEEALTPAECFAREPALANTRKKLVGGMFASIDASGDIFAFTQRLAKLAAERYGVTFLYNQPVARLHRAHGAISHVEVEGQGRDYLGGFDAYVMALGSYSSKLLRSVGLYVPIYPMKGYSISFTASDACPKISITDDAAKQVYSLLGPQMRVAGTAEFAGYNDAVREARIAPLKRGMQELFPDAPMENVSEWACLRPSTPDGPPVIGTTPIRNLYMNTGHGTLGWTQAAGSARLLADVIDGRPTEIPLSGFEAERWWIGR